VSYEAEARQIWRTLIPPNGQASTVQGELLRAVEKLRDEAQRNGNVNWDQGHVILARFVRGTLTGSGLFDARKRKQIESDIERLLDYNHPETGDVVYDRLSKRVVDHGGPSRHPLSAGSVPMLASGVAPTTVPPTWPSPRP
jgi:hypothetical protein